MEEGKAIWKEGLIERIFADIDRYWFTQGNTKHLNENPFESTSLMDSLFSYLFLSFQPIQ